MEGSYFSWTGTLPATLKESLPLHEKNSLATIVGEKTAGRLLSATSAKVGHGLRLAFPTRAYYTWKGFVIEGTPIEPDQSVAFDWREARRGNDPQLKHSIELLEKTLTR